MHTRQGQDQFYRNHAHGWCLPGLIGMYIEAMAFTAAIVSMQLTVTITFAP